MDGNENKCGATFELACGEYVSPCRLPKDHEGDCQGTCLGSVCFWPKGIRSEYEMHIRSLTLDGKL